MPTLEFLSRLTYLAMEGFFIGSVAAALWLFHFRFLWARRWRILAGVALVSAYALPLDAWAVARGWGGFNPAYVSGLYFFGSLLLGGGHLLAGNLVGDHLGRADLCRIGAAWRPLVGAAGRGDLAVGGF